jgi:ribonucleotide reductase alpha subunit
MRNSLLMALMPTASSSQLINSNEAFEPFTSNIYTRSTHSGEFIVVNKHLYRDLKDIDMWNKELVDQIISQNGSIQDIEQIPLQIRNRYKTVWELSQKVIIDLAADRAPFIDQTQSMNIFVERPTYAKLSSMHMYGWKQGLKTGSYYIRSKPARDAVKFTVASSNNKKSKNELKNDEGCLMCSA